MKTIGAARLAKNLGISRFTVRDWCQKIPGLAYKRRNVWVIRLAKLAEMPGFDAVKVHLLTQKTWVKAVLLAEKAGMSRRTLSYWCKNSPSFAIRIGRIWYVCVDSLDATSEQNDALTLVTRAI